MSMRNFVDERGTLKFLVDTPPFEIKQCIRSYNHKNVLRGIHCSPYKKYITCNRGKLFDVIVYTDGSHKTFILEENDTLLVPENCGHGYYCLEDTEISYFFGGVYDPSNEKNYHYRDPTLNIDWPCTNPIVSEKDDRNQLFKEIEHLVLGSSGFIGSWIKDAFPGCTTTDTRLEDIADYIKFVKPKKVISAAGISGKPTIQWCENNKRETVFTNLTNQLNLIEVCAKLDIHLTIIGSGAVFKGNGTFTEKDEPNFHDMFYSHTRTLLEDVIKSSYIDKVLYLRVMYPISGDGDPKCFLTKLKGRVSSIHDVEVNCTHLPTMILDMLPKIVGMKLTGIYNFVNEGAISISEILKMLDVEHTVVPFDNSRPTGLLSMNKLSNIIKIPTIIDVLDESKP